MKWREKLTENLKSIYVSNLPEDWRASDAKDVLRKVGLVMDVYMPDKKNKEGKSFVFARFDKNADMENILKALRGLWIGKYKILANYGIFERQERVKKISIEERRSFPIPNKRRQVEKSYVEAVKEKGDLVIGSMEILAEVPITGKEGNKEAVR